MNRPMRSKLWVPAPRPELFEPPGIVRRDTVAIQQTMLTLRMVAAQQLPLIAQG